MDVVQTGLNGLLLIKPKVFGDKRGFFYEMFQEERYRAAGVDVHFVQDNVSSSAKNVLRGLHFQTRNPQDKLVSVLVGEVFDVAVDIRPESATFGKWFGAILSEENHHQLFVPKGFAHGFCVLSDTAIFHYKCSDYYSPANESGIIWNDPALGIEWPLQGEPIVSEKDTRYLPLAETLE
ncbi:MAG: dTDP-4-dehydrorhamnose 3,5-epimerase [Gammaproteobacteria bacterium]